MPSRTVKVESGAGIVKEVIASAIDLTGMVFLLFGSSLQQLAARIDPVDVQLLEITWPDENNLATGIDQENKSEYSPVHDE